MTVRQLRPDQKKLWRRIYLQSMDRGDGAEKAAKEADLTVTQWEARNAFDEEGDQSTVLRGGRIANAGYDMLTLSVEHVVKTPIGEVSHLPAGTELRMVKPTTETGYMQYGGSGFKP